MTSRRTGDDQCDEQLFRTNPIPVMVQSETAIPACSQGNTNHFRRRRLRRSVKVAKTSSTGVGQHAN